MPARVVMLYIEPTPYVVALIDTLRRHWGGSIDVNYITTDLTQPWNMQLELDHGKVLPNGFFVKMRAIWTLLRHDRNHTILHLAGWGHPVLAGTLLMAGSLRIPVAVESDTPEGRPVRHWRRLFKQLFYPYLLRLPTRFLPGGTRQARYLAGFGVRQDRITVAQMTVDVCAIRRFCAMDRKAVRAAARTSWGMLFDERIVLFVGRLEPYKGVEVLLSAFARSVQGENELRLAIVGDGSLRPRVEALALDHDRRIIYLGRLSGDDVLRAYVAADFVVLPSLTDGWGLVINEAMACGLPVIVTDRVGCADDLVRDGETGLMVRAGRESELAAAILRLVRDKPERARMAHAAETLISNWTLANEARNITFAWSEIAG